MHYLLLTPSSRSVFCAGVSLNIHSFVHSFLPSLRVSSAYEQAVRCLETNEFEDILGLCATEIERSDSPHAAKALLLRATFSILCGLGDQALSDLSKLLQMEGLDPKVRY